MNANAAIPNDLRLRPNLPAMAMLMDAVPGSVIRQVAGDTPYITLYGDHQVVSIGGAACYDLWRFTRRMKRPAMVKPDATLVEACEFLLNEKNKAKK